MGSRFLVAMPESPVSVRMHLRSKAAKDSRRKPSIDCWPTVIFTISRRISSSFSRARSVTKSNNCVSSLFGAQLHAQMCCHLMLDVTKPSVSFVCQRQNFSLSCFSAKMARTDASEKVRQISELIMFVAHRNLRN